MKTTRVQHPDAIATEDICLEDDGPGAIVHARGEDCARLHGLRIVRRECSVCGQEWGDGAVSQHTYCGRLYDDGSRSYSECWAILSDGSRLEFEEA